MRQITELDPDLVFVALGAPQQELLIHKYFRSDRKGIYIGVGGSFDVLSGKKQRAPSFLYVIIWSGCIGLRKNRSV